MARLGRGFPVRPHFHGLLPQNMPPRDTPVSFEADGSTAVQWSLAVDGVLPVFFTADGQSDVSFALGGAGVEISFAADGSGDASFGMAGALFLSFEADGATEVLFAAVSDPGSGSGAIPQEAPTSNNLAVEFTLTLTGFFDVLAAEGASAI